MTDVGFSSAQGAKENKILVVLTGGTICSRENIVTGELVSDADRAKAEIIRLFEQSGSPFYNAVSFVEDVPLNILSENMTTSTWNTLIDRLKTYDWSDYKGVIILHGTDTLAYTAALLSILLAGIRIPVFLVSSLLPLGNPGANGGANFKAAVELIMNGIAPNVYAVYRNSDGLVYVHEAAHLTQCVNEAGDFFSKDAKAVSGENAASEGTKQAAQKMLLYEIDALRPCVLRVAPYVGLDYGVFRLDGVETVVHGTYHSETACVERNREGEAYTNLSVLSLLARCKDAGIPLFLEPCSKKYYCYESTGDLIRSGAIPVTGMTDETVYARALVGCALGLRGDSLIGFIKINNK